MITGIQCRMARAALGWAVQKLAERSGVGINTVSRFENDAETLASTVRKIQAALQAAGVEFIDSGDGGPGVRLREDRS